MRLIAMQSKKWIGESFLDLLSIKPLNSITINEIAQNAELDRRTFYRHFKTKEDVISFFIHEEAKKCAEALRQNKEIGNFTIAKAFFGACVEMKEMLIILYKQNILHLFLVELNLLFPKYQQQLADQKELQMENRDFLLAYHIGGFWNLLIKWLDDNCNNTPEQMAEIVEQVFLFQQI